MEIMRCAAGSWVTNTGRSNSDPGILESSVTNPPSYLPPMAPAATVTRMPLTAPER
jgi:hypothetical protein